MKVLVPTNWMEPIQQRLAQRNQLAQLLAFDAEHSGPFPGVEVFFRGDGAQRWSEALAQAPQVRWVHTTSAGINGVLEETAPRGLTLTESGVVYRICIGEFVMGMILLAAKRLGTLWDQSRQEHWQWIQQDELYGKTVGIVGLGPIGLGVAERAEGFGMHVIGCRRTGQPIENVTDVVPPSRLNELLERSDYVVLSLPLTDQSKGMLDSSALAHMKHSAWLINIARGQLVDTDALMAALNEGRIAGVCTDVTDPEPLPPGHPLWKCPNTFITPHTSPGHTTALLQRKIDHFLDNLQRYQQGQPLEGLVQEHRGY